MNHTPSTKTLTYLNQLKKEQRINSGVSKLEQRLQGYLFNDKPEPLNAGEIECLIVQLSRQTITYAQIRGNAKSDPGLLAEL